MNYIDNGIVEWFSLALRNHQTTHFNDDINGMEIELLFHRWNIMIIIKWNTLLYNWIIKWKFEWVGNVYLMTIVYIGK